MQKCVFLDFEKCQFSFKFLKCPYSRQSYCPIHPNFGMRVCFLSRFFYDIFGIWKKMYFSLNSQIFHLYRKVIVWFSPNLACKFVYSTCAWCSNLSYTDTWEQDMWSSGPACTWARRNLHNTRRCGAADTRASGQRETCVPFMFKVISEQLKSPEAHQNDTSWNKKLFMQLLWQVIWREKSTPEAHQHCTPRNKRLFMWLLWQVICMEESTPDTHQLCTPWNKSFMRLLWQGI